jgi:putative oxidoreductase
MTLRDRYHTLASIGHNMASALTWLPPLVARITIGVVFVQSGWGKLQNLPAMIERFRGWGIPAPAFQAPFASASELIFGGLVLVGLFTRFSAIPLIIIMVVAMKSVAYDGAEAIKQGTFNYLFGLMEYLYVVILLWLAIYGPGAFSLDRIFFHKSDGKH